MDCNATCQENSEHHGSLYAPGKDVKTHGSTFMKASPLCSDESNWNGATVVWRDVTVTIKGKRMYSEKVISTSTGYALPGNITGLMGPPRSGKSTLLRALSGLLPKHAKIYGETFINGCKGPTKHGSFAYVNDRNHLIEKLTVKETLTYSALLQLPNHFSLLQKHAMVEEILTLMELKTLANFQIGGWFRSKGLSIGEKQRLSIATELLKKPSLIFIDEPIHHLDSVSALTMMVTLKRLSQTGCTVIITIQNSGTESFSLLDRICLIAHGKTVFFGDIPACLEHFSNAGFPCPLQQNPSDYIIKALNHDFEKILKVHRHLQDCDHEGEAGFPTISTDLIIQTLESVFNGSNEAATVESMVIQLSKKEGTNLNFKRNVDPLTQLVILTWRSFLNMRRDWQYFWLRVFLSILLTVCLGTMYIGLQQSLSSQEQVSALFYMTVFICLIGIGGFPALVKELKVHAKESSYGHLGHIRTFNFIIGNLLSSIPYLFLIASTCSAIGYGFLVLHPDFGSFAFFTLSVFLCLLISEGLMMVIASFLPQTSKGIVTVIVIQGIMVLLSGYFRPVNKLPKPIWKYPASYGSFYVYMFEGFLKDRMISTEQIAPSMDGQYNDEQLNYSMSSLFQGKWGNILILAAMSMVYRIFLFFIISLQKL